MSKDVIILQQRMLRLLLHFNLFINVIALFSPDSVVVQLTDKNFEKLVLKSERIWYVKFYAPWCGYCQRFAPEFDKAAKALKGIARLGAVNVDQEKYLADKYAIESYPTVKLFVLSQREPEEFRGERSANALVQSAISAVQRKINHQLSGKPNTGPKINRKDVIKLTDNNFKDIVLNSSDMWMINFYAPWCKTCQKFEPVWSEAAEELKGKAKFGYLDVTVNKLTADNYKINKYPTIKYFPVGFKKEILDYKLKKTKEDIVEFVMKIFLDSKPSRKSKQIINYNIFEEECVKEQLCIISFFPDLIDCPTKCRRTYLKMLRKVSGKFKEKLWGWLWTVGGEHIHLENALDIGGFGFPAMVVLNMKKMKYTTLRGSFSEVGIGEFLRDISYGRGNVADLTGKIEIFEVEAWDGTDSSIPPKLTQAHEEKIDEGLETGKIRKKKANDKYGSKKTNDGEIKSQCREEDECEGISNDNAITNEEVQEEEVCKTSEEENCGAKTFKKETNQKQNCEDQEKCENPKTANVNKQNSNSKISKN